VISDDEIRDMIGKVVHEAPDQSDLRKVEPTSGRWVATRRDTQEGPIACNISQRRLASNPMNCIGLLSKHQMLSG
jgi:hypothetical protein